MLFAKLIIITSILLSILLTSCSAFSTPDIFLLGDNENDNVQSQNLTEYNNTFVNEYVSSKSMTLDNHMQNGYENNNAQFHDSTENNEISANEPVDSEPTVLMTEYYSGEFQTGYKGDFNNDIVIALNFTVKIDQTVYHRGDKVTLRIDAQNIGPAFMYVPQYGSPDAFLRHEEYTNGKSYSKGYTTYSIYRGDVIMPEGIPDEKLCDIGSTWSNIVEINIPENALIGLYDIIVFSHGYTTIVKNAFEIIK